MMGLGLMIVAYIISVKRNYPVQPAKSLKKFFKIFLRSLPALLVPLIIIGGIAFGVFTPTEAAAVAVAYCMAYWISKSLWISKDCCTMESLADCIFASAKTSASILWIVGAARGVSWILAKEGVASLIYEYILLLNPSPTLFVLIINILLLVVGCLMETSAALFIFVPIILPLAAIVGFNQFHMAFIIGMNLAIGLTTPPVGLSLYVSANIGKISLGKASKAVLPFVGIQILVLLIVSYIPIFVLWLPRLAGLLK
jgi:tripartite ATP-independent transporter DctM subunit